MKMQLLAITALIAVTAIWGSTFIVVQNAISEMPVMDFLAIRFTVAAIVLFLWRPRCLKSMTLRGWVRSILIGISLCLGFITQTYGLQYTSAAVSGFITGMFVVITPLISWLLLRREISLSIWVAVALATIGLGFLSLKGWSIGAGELLTFLCAIFFAFHIVSLGEWAVKYDAYGVALIQIGVVAIISMVAAIPDGITLPPSITVWGAVILTAIFASAVGFLVQTWAQTIISPSRAAITLTMEPVFAGIFAVFIGGEQLTLRLIAGAVLVLSAMLITSRRAEPHLRTLEP
ncbi:MAG: DMT family transporter [Dehalococcoidia bacterium]|nr:MAG: DMT family transporter [Dehalococcoidia bacterium]